MDKAHGLGALRSRYELPHTRERLRLVLTLLVTVLLLGGLFLSVPGLAPVGLRTVLDRGPHALGHPPIVAGAGPYRFMHHQPGDPSTPVAWDPCRAIHYVVNPEGGPTDAIDLVAAAVAHVSSATGLRFEYDGTTEHRPHWGSPYVPSVLRGNAPVLVSWATSNEVDDLAGDVAGIGGAVPAPTPTRLLRYVSGGVTLDSDTYAQLERRPGGRVEERAILLHELGHLVGLAHVHDARELMNVGVEVPDYARGDRAGLAKLGAGRCF